MKKLQEKILNYFRKNSKETTLSKIDSFIFKEKEQEDYYYFKKCVKGIFNVSRIVNGKKEKFTIITETTEWFDFKIRILDSNNVVINNIDISATIRPIDAKSFYLHFIDIKSQNPKYKGYGFGRLMMEAMFYTIDYFANHGKNDNDKLSFLYVKGTLGVGASYTPEKSIKLYNSFENFCFNNCIIHVKKEYLNIYDKEIFFEIVDNC